MKEDKWFGPKDSGFYFGGKNAVDFYNQNISRRREEIAIKNNHIFDDKVQELNTKGFTKWSQTIDQKILQTINEKVTHFIEQGKNLKLHNSDYSVIENPFLHFDEVFELAFRDEFLEFAKEYFNCMPAIGTFNLRRSYANPGPPSTTQLFHCDKNSVKFFKLFIYLNDVDDPSEGPLTLIGDSVQKKPKEVFSKLRWSDEEIKELYGEDSFNYLTAKRGDVIAATTTSFHKGNKPTKKDRTMLTINYVIHPELSGNFPIKFEEKFKIKNSQYEQLSEYKKRAADFLNRV